MKSFKVESTPALARGLRAHPSVRGVSGACRSRFAHKGSAAHVSEGALVTHWTHFTHSLSPTILLRSGTNWILGHYHTLQPHVLTVAPLWDQELMRKKQMSKDLSRRLQQILRRWRNRNRESISAKSGAEESQLGASTQILPSEQVTYPCSFTARIPGTRAQRPDSRALDVRRTRGLRRWNSVTHSTSPSIPGGKTHWAGLVTSVGLRAALVDTWCHPSGPHLLPFFHLTPKAKSFDPVIGRRPVAVLLHAQQRTVNPSGCTLPNVLSTRGSQALPRQRPPTLTI